MNGVRLHHEEHGRGEPIVWIHGTASSSLVWPRSAIDAMSELGRVIVYDRRGYGRSEHRGVFEISVDEHVQDAAALIRAVRAAPAVVVGRSYGGEVALGLELRHADLVRALVLLEPASFSLDPEANAWADDLRRKVDEAAARDPGSIAETFLRSVLGDAAWESFKPEVKRMYAEDGPAIAAEVRGAFLEVSQGDLARISVPTLIVAGEGSREAFRRVSERVAAAIPGARLELVGGGHRIDPGEPGVLGFVRSVLAT